MPKGRSLIIILSVLLFCPLPAYSRTRYGESQQKQEVDLVLSGASSRAQLTKTDDMRVTPVSTGAGLPLRRQGGESSITLRPSSFDLTTSVGERFYEIAYGLASSEYITAPQAEQAILFLTAAKDLGYTNDQIQPLLIKLACDHSEQDYSQQIYRWLEEYINEPTEGGFDSVQGFALVDLEIVKKAIMYLLDRCDSREQREKVLESVIGGLARLGGKNPALDSELATSLGLLMVEKANFRAAKSLFVRAYMNNKYNKLAFAKLVELSPDEVGPTNYFEHLRFMLRENPLDIDAALSFAQYAESASGGHLYEIAAAAYQYCDDLFSYLYPNEALPSNIYIPWLICTYNSFDPAQDGTEQDQSRCLEIAERVRRSGRFDILVEAIAGRAAAKIGNPAEANRIFQAAESKALQLLDGRLEVPAPRLRGDKLAPAEGPRLAGTQAGGGFGAKHLAWFYCFAQQDALKALDWANKAYSIDPNSAVAAALLAYALSMNQHLEWAQPLIENYEHNQITDLVQAQMQLAKGQKDAAIETLKVAISKDPGSLAAERAKELLAQQGQAYAPPIHPDYVLITLRNSFGQSIVPKFMSPDKIISVRFNTGGNELAYTSQFGPPGQIAIVNNSSEPFIISDDGLFSGSIRIDANISGDLNKRIPKLVSRKIGSTWPIEPGGSILIPVRLFTGELRQLLLSYPQASSNIEFTLYLDPIVTDQGEITNRLADIKPVKVMVRRPGIELSSSFLQNQFHSILTGQASQKIHVAELFVGLLKEQHAMAEQGALYRYKYADWMPSFLKSALLKESGLLLNSAAEDEWVVKIHTMAEMLFLPLDAELMNVVAKNLNHPKWPVRMMAVYLLAESSDNTFDRVLHWVAENDSSWLVRDMSAALIAGFGEGPRSFGLAATP